MASASKPYWAQFAGREDRLRGYVEDVQHRLERPGVEIVNFGLIDSPSKAFKAGHRFRREDVDLIFLHVTTYALSPTSLRHRRRSHRAEAEKLAALLGLELAQVC